MFSYTFLFVNNYTYFGVWAKRLMHWFYNHVYVDLTSPLNAIKKFQSSTLMFLIINWIYSYKSKKFPELLKIIERN